MVTNNIMYALITNYYTVYKNTITYILCTISTWNKDIIILTSREWREVSDVLECTPTALEGQHNQKHLGTLREAEVH